MPIGPVFALEGMDTIRLCICGHWYDEHIWNGRGRCRGLDSYGIRCTCPSPQPWDDDEDYQTSHLALLGRGRGTSS